MAINYPTSLDTFTTKVDNVDDVSAVDINDIQDAVEALEAKVGADSSVVTTSFDYKVNNFFASGRKVWLYENTAPTGWSITAVTDGVLAVKGGSNAYNVDGGNTAGTWTSPGHTHTGPSHTHTGPSHTHTVDSHTHTGPSHTHTVPQEGYSIRSGTETQNYCIGLSSFDSNHVYNIATDAGGTGATGAATPSTNAGGTGATGAEGTGATGSGATAATWRPYATVGIIITKT